MPGREELGSGMGCRAPRPEGMGTPQSAAAGLLGAEPYWVSLVLGALRVTQWRPPCLGSSCGSWRAARTARSWWGGASSRGCVPRRLLSLGFHWPPPRPTPRSHRARELPGRRDDVGPPGGAEEQFKKEKTLHTGLGALELSRCQARCASRSPAFPPHLSCVVPALAAAPSCWTTLDRALEFPALLSPL